MVKDSNRVNIPQIPQQPVGGALRGIDEAYRPMLATGMSQFEFPLTISQARALTPELVLRYHSGAGKGLFGIGFCLDFISITRSTKWGVPKYNDEDIFISSIHGELVYIHEEKKQEEHKSFTRRYYRPRVDRDHHSIVWVIDNDKNKSYWEINTTDGVCHILGYSDKGKINHPENQSKTYEWMIEETCDAFGNKVCYDYHQGVSDSRQLNDRVVVQPVLKDIRYGNYTVKKTQKNSQNEDFIFELRFHYNEELSLEKPIGESILPETGRVDTTRSHRPGFILETKYLCRRIEQYHHFKDDIGSALTHYWQFHYTTDKKSEGYHLSCLAELESVGCRQNPIDKNSYLTKSLPKISFDYTSILSNDQLTFEKLLSDSDSAPLSNINDSYQLVDLYREGLPGVLYTDAFSAWYQRSLGAGKFESPKLLQQFPLEVDMSQSYYLLTALGPEQHTAIVNINEQQAGFFKLRTNQPSNKNDNDKSDKNLHQIEWSAFQCFDEYPNFNNGMPIDITGNGQADWVVLDPLGSYYFPGLGERGYGAYKDLKLPPDFPISVTNIDALRTFTDIYGDGLLHRIEVTNGKMRVWPNLGDGRFSPAEDFVIPRYCEQDHEFDPRNIRCVDIDGSGAADLVYLYHDHLMICYNKGHGFSEALKKVEFKSSDCNNKLTYTHNDQVIIGDIFGDCTKTVLLMKETANTISHYTCKLSLVKPHLLEKVINHFGSVTSLTYGVSTTNYLLDRKNNSIKYPILPFAMPVIQKVVTKDCVTDMTLTQRYEYHGGTYDFRERRFGGFALVEQWDDEKKIETEKQQGSEYTTTRYTKRWYACGQIDPTKEYKSNFYPDESNLTISNTVYYKEQQDKIDPELNRAYLGQLIREEIYSAEDKSIPLQTMECSYHLACLKKSEHHEHEASLDQHGIFVVCPKDIVTAHYSGSEKAKEPPRIERVIYEWSHQPKASYLLDKNAEKNLVLFLNQISEYHVFYGREDIQNQSTQDFLEKYITVYELPESINQDEKRVSEIIKGQCSTSLIVSRSKYCTSIEYTDKNQQKTFYFLSINQSKTVEATLEVNLTCSSYEDIIQKENLTLYRHQKFNYWDDSLSTVRVKDSNIWQVPPLLHHQENILFREEVLNEEHPWSVFLDKKEDDMQEKHLVSMKSLLVSAGFKKESDTYWQPGLVNHYKKEAYYQIVRVTQLEWDESENINTQYYHDQEITYDSYQLAINQIKTGYQYKDKNELIKREFSVYVLMDYHTVKPWVVSDHNENKTLCLYDPLGRTVAETRYGSFDGRLVGNPPPCLNEPLKNHKIENEKVKEWLTNEAFHFIKKQQEIASADNVIAQVKEQNIRSMLYFSNEIEQGWWQRIFYYCFNHIMTPENNHSFNHPSFGVNFSSFDYYKVIRTESQDENKSFDVSQNNLDINKTAISIDYYDGLGHITQTKLKAEDGEEQQTQWVTSGLKIHNSKGSVIEEYLPYYSNTPTYTQKSAKEQDVTDSLRHHYDALDRLIQQVTPKGFIREIKYSPWSNLYYDENDNLSVKSDLRTDIRENELISFCKKHHGNTPNIIFYNTHGDTCAHVSLYRSQLVDSKSKINSDNDPVEYRITLANYDMIGQIKSYQDARLGKNNITYHYDLLGNIIEKNSVDSGKEILLYERNKKLFSKSHGTWRHSYKYDNWQRIIEQKSINTNNKLSIIERMYYGETIEDIEKAKNRNQLEQLVKWEGNDAVIENEYFDLLSNAIKINNKIFFPSLNKKGNKIEEQGKNNILTKDFSILKLFNAFGMLVEQKLPGNIKQTWSYTNLGQWFSTEINDKALVKSVNYHPTGQKSSTEYVNDLKTNYEYEKHTHRLSQIQTTKGNVTYQDLSYYYDPMGNISYITRGWFYHNNHKIFNKRTYWYTYDSLYQLISATGRELKNNPITNNQLLIHQQSLENIKSNLNTFSKFKEIYRYDKSGNLIDLQHTIIDDTKNPYTKHESFLLNNQVQNDSNLLSTHNLSQNHQIKDSKAIKNDDVGNITEIGDQDKLSWNHHNNLSFFSREVNTFAQENSEKSKIYEHYGYKTNDRTDLFQDSLNNKELEPKQARFSNPAYKNTREDNTDNTDNIVNVYSNRVYRIFIKITGNKSNEQVILVENFYIGNYRYQKESIWKDDKWIFSKKRHSVMIKDDRCQIATYHQYQANDDHHQEKEIILHLTDNIDSVVTDLYLHKDNRWELLAYQEFTPYGANAFLLTTSNDYLSKNDYHYSSQELDESGLYYYGERHYSPQLGRWMSADPAGHIDGLSRHIFAMSNPISKKDYLGLWGECMTNLCSGIKITVKGIEYVGKSIASPIGNAITGTLSTATVIVQQALVMGANFRDATGNMTDYGLGFVGSMVIVDGLSSLANGSLDTMKSILNCKWSMSNFEKYMSSLKIFAPIITAALQLNSSAEFIKNNIGIDIGAGVTYLAPGCFDIVTGSVNLCMKDQIIKDEIRKELEKLKKLEKLEQYFNAFNDSKDSDPYKAYSCAHITKNVLSLISGGCSTISSGASISSPPTAIVFIALSYLANMSSIYSGVAADKNFKTLFKSLENRINQMESSNLENGMQSNNLAQINRINQGMEQLERQNHSIVLHRRRNSVPAPRVTLRLDCVT